MPDLLTGEAANERSTAESPPASDMLSVGRKGEGTETGLPSAVCSAESMLQLLSLRSKRRIGEINVLMTDGSVEGVESISDGFRKVGAVVFGMMSGGGEKNRTRKVYSADALSNNTSSSDRKSASTGCF